MNGTMTQIGVAFLVLALPLANACSSQLGTNDSRADAGVRHDALIDAPVFDLSATDAPADAFLSDASSFDAGSDAGPGTEFFTVTYQAGVMPTNVYRDLPAGHDDDRLSVVAAPWDPTHFALRVVLADGDQWNGEVYPRTEITPTISPRMALGTRYRFVSGFWFPSDSIFPADDPAGCSGSPRPNEMIAPFQMHGGDGFAPVVSSQLFEGELRLSFLGTNREANRPEYLTVSRPPMTGRYIPFEIVYLPSYESDGYVRVTIDGEVILDRSGPNQSGTPTSETTGGFFKQGLYDYWCTVLSELVVYLDDLHVYRY